jgi:hypothetical protein
VELGPIAAPEPAMPAPETAALDTPTPEAPAPEVNARETPPLVTQALEVPARETPPLVTPALEAPIPLATLPARSVLTPRSLPSLLHLDRYRNEGTRVYSPHAGYSEARERYRPDSRYPSFHLPVFQLPVGEMRVFEANPPPALRELYLRSDAVAFSVHPQVLEEAPEDPYLKRTLALGTRLDPILVAPSSSTRTLYVLDPSAPAGPAHSTHPTYPAHPAYPAYPAHPAHPTHLAYPTYPAHPAKLAVPHHALKVHFPFRISRYGRKMREEVVEQAVNVSRELEAGVGSMDGRFAFLREVLGVTHPDLDTDSPRGENWGYLVRDMAPFPPSVDERLLIPGFALYGGDFLQPTRPSLIMEVAAVALAGRMPDAGGALRLFLLDTLFLPIVRHWVDCFLHFGLILEPHGQNVLLEVDGEGRIQRIVHRDLSLGIDMRRRRDLGLSSDDLNQYNRMEDGTFASIAYDRMMGGHFFDHVLAPVLAAFPSLSTEDFRGPCRVEFTRLFPDHQRYLPGTVHYFREERDEYGKPLYQDTGQAPEWRP